MVRLRSEEMQKANETHARQLKFLEHVRKDLEKQLDTLQSENSSVKNGKSNDE